MNKESSKLFTPLNIRGPKNTSANPLSVVAEHSEWNHTSTQPKVIASFMDYIPGVGRNMEK